MKTGEKQQGSQCFSNLSIANQLFAVLIRLRLGLLITDVSTRFKIPEATYSHMFICFLSKELCLIFPFLRVNKQHSGCLGDLRNIFQTPELLQIAMKLNASVHQALLTPPSHIPTTKAEILGKYWLDVVHLDQSVLFLMLGVGGFRIEKLQKSQDYWIYLKKVT